MSQLLLLIDDRGRHDELMTNFYRTFNCLADLIEHSSSQSFGTVRCCVNDTKKATSIVAIGE